jgi:diaminopimelate decarboxylase
MSLDLCRQFPDVNTLNLGGGYKTGRMKHEKSTDLQLIGEPVRGELFFSVVKSNQMIDAYFRVF